MVLCAGRSGEPGSGAGDPIETKQQLPPEPRLQAQPRLDLKALREGEDQVLTTYAWVDPDRGIARIPIAEAIKIVAAERIAFASPRLTLPDADGFREIPSVASSAQNVRKDLSMKLSSCTCGVLLAAASDASDRRAGQLRAPSRFETS